MAESNGNIVIINDGMTFKEHNNESKRILCKNQEQNPQTAKELANAIGDVVDGLNNEAKELIKKRHVTRGDGCRAIIRELNNKWNAIAALFEKDYGMSPISRNRF